MVAAAAHDLLPNRRLQPPQRPPLGLMPEPRRARVKGVSGAHHGEVGASCGFLGLRFHYTRDPRPPQVGAIKCGMLILGALYLYGVSIDPGSNIYMAHTIDDNTNTRAGTRCTYTPSSTR